MKNLPNLLGDDRPNRLKGSRSPDYLLGLAGNDWLWGFAQADTLSGGEGNDLLDGGTGADLLAGGPGNDTYIVDNRKDQIFEQPNQGRDLIKTTISLALNAELENLQLIGTQPLTGIGGVAKNLLTGNEANNTLIGLAGDDTLSGLGGDDLLIGDGKGNQPFGGKIGKDRMLGGAGNDTYYVNSKADRVIEALNQGIDTVIANLSDYTLPDQLDNLYLFDGSGNSATGNALDNQLFGNKGNNSLDGQAGDDTLDGGTGIDQMMGGLGDDRYLIDRAEDVIIELADQGIDMVLSQANYTLPDHIEQLYLQGANLLAGTGNSLNNLLSGNDADNLLVGGAGNDTLIGRGGNDSLTGGDGEDLFFYTMPDGQPFASSAFGLDTITDFRSDRNLLVLSKSAFGLSSNSSPQGVIGFSIFNEFASVADDNTAALSSARIVFSQATGRLFYNANQQQAGFGQVNASGAFAQLQGVTTLSFLDFAIVS